MSMPPTWFPHMREVNQHDYDIDDADRRPKYCGRCNNPSGVYSPECPNKGVTHA